MEQLTSFLLNIQAYLSTGGAPHAPSGFPATSQPAPLQQLLQQYNTLQQQLLQLQQQQQQQQQQQAASWALAAATPAPLTLSAPQSTPGMLDQELLTLLPAIPPEIWGCVQQLLGRAPHEPRLQEVFLEASMAPFLRLSDGTLQPLALPPLPLPQALGILSSLLLPGAGMTDPFQGNDTLLLPNTLHTVTAIRFPSNPSAISALRYTVGRAASQQAAQLSQQLLGTYTQYQPVLALQAAFMADGGQQVATGGLPVLPAAQLEGCTTRCTLGYL